MTMLISSRVALADYILTANKLHINSLLRDIILVTCFNLLIIFCGQIAFPLPFTTVPLSLQTLGVLLTGAALGSRRGGLSVLAYILEGAMGMPVFASGTGGIGHLIGVTGGYLFSFPFAAFITGWLCERKFDRNFKTGILAMLPGTIIIYLFGVSWLAFLLHLSFQKAIIAGLLPFIPGDIIKMIFVGLFLPTLWRAVRSRKII